jgi:NADH-quinone oxidoreductase subunit M
MPTLLVITILLPLVAGVVLACGFPRVDYRVARATALGVTLLTLGLSLILALGFDKTAAASYQFAVYPDGPDASAGLPWIALGHGPGIRLALGLDGVALVLFVLTTLLMIPSVFASWEPVKARAPLHYALMLALETGLLGLFASMDVILFYAFFEFTLIPLFFLIGIYGGDERRWASIYFFLYTLAGSLLTLLGVIALVAIHQQHSPGHVLTFSIPELSHGLGALKWPDWQYRPGVTSLTSPQVLIFLLLFAGFAIKVPLFPFHTWLPLAHVQAPTAGSILLAGVLLKVGSYGFLRFNLGMTPHGALYLLPFLGTLCVAGIIYGALTALAQSDAKRLVAYSSVSHMGFIALGLFSLTTTGIDGAVIQMVNHGLTTGALFACVGIFYERYHTREMSELGGLWQRMPLFAFFLILASLGSAALPGLNGFVGEFPILLGMFSRSPVFAVTGAIGMVLGAYYLLVMIRRLLFGPLVEPHHGHDHDHDHPAVPPVAWYEIAGLTPLMVLIVLIGVYPRPIFERISPPVRQIASRFYVEPETGGEPGGGGGGRGARPGGGGGGPGGRRPSQPTAKAPQAIAPTLALRSPTLD